MVGRIIKCVLVQSLGGRSAIRVLGKGPRKALDILDVNISSRGQATGIDTVAETT